MVIFHKRGFNMKTFWSNYKSSVILLASMIIGGIVGAIWGEGATVLEPVADIFLHLLYCCVVPLIFCSLSSAIARMQDMKKLRKILLTFLALTFATGVISALFQAVSVILFDPAKGAVVDMTEKVTDATGSLNILGMFTVGDFPQLFSKSNLMALIVFTILFAFAIIKTGEKGRPVVEALDRLTAVIVNLINIVMKIAPIGLGCYFAMLIGQYGSSVVGPLGRSIVIYLVVSILYFVISQTVMAYIGAGKEGVKTWWKGCVAPALTALGTCSSAATLPVNMQHAREIGIPEDVADVAIPLGANLHKDGSCMIQIVKIALLCGLMGTQYATPRNIFMSVVVAVIAAVVMGGIPAGGYVGELFILSAFDFDPAVAIPIMVLLGTITDAISTAINVTGDTGLAMIIARVTDGKDWFRKAQAK